MEHVAKSFCRSCGSWCPIDVTLKDGRVEKVEGNPSAPLYEGFICPKGRALAAMHNNPNRLLHHQKRMPDGSYQPISSEQLVAEVSAKLAMIIEKHGPKSIAGFLGSGTTDQQAGGAMMTSLLTAIGADWMSTSVTLDQPGLPFADALHGTWAGGRTRPEKCEVFMIVGGNPIISKQYFPQNPGQQLKQRIKEGMKLIVIDPRRTETARKAHVHLQCIPGEDPTIIAGLIHLVIANSAVNLDFVNQNAAGFDQLKAAVAEFTPAYVCDRAGIAEADLREAARLIGEARQGDLGSGVGPAMATRGTLMAYLLRCLQTLRGFWAEAGDEASFPHVLQSHMSFRAQPNPPQPAWGFGRKSRVRGFEMTVLGMPTAALPDEILTPGEGQIRAMFLFAGPMNTWPQTDKVRQALETIDLLVTHDTEMSPTSAMAHYVVATMRQFEVPVMTQFVESVVPIHPGYGWVQPFAGYGPALLKPPSDSDLLESWQFYYRVAQKMGLTLQYGTVKFDGPAAGALPSLDMKNEPTTDDLYEMACAGSVVPLSEVKKYPDGHVFDQAREIVQPRDPACVARLELANDVMLNELAEVRNENVVKRRGLNDEFPYLFIPRRMQHSGNSARTVYAPSKWAHNPAFMHPADMAQLGIKSGDTVRIRSRHGEIQGIVEADEALRTGVLAMTHGFGGGRGMDRSAPRAGANVNELLHWEDDYDPYHGMPRMGALPISIIPVRETSRVA